MYSVGNSSREGTDLSDYVAAMMASCPQQDPTSILEDLDTIPFHLISRAAYDLAVEQERQEAEEQQMAVKACKASSTSLERLAFGFVKPTTSFVKYCESLGSNAFGAKV